MQITATTPDAFDQQFLAGLTDEQVRGRVEAYSGAGIATDPRKAGEAQWELDRRAAVQAERDAAGVVQIGLEAATVARLDAIIAAAGLAGLAGFANRGEVIGWASERACTFGYGDVWRRVTTAERHEAATRGPVVLVDVAEDVERGLCGAVGAATFSTFEPVYATAVAWFLDVAALAGFRAPGE
ncbi:hypothetical protein [Micromonospora sp. RP3T]|uniref:hypothetical protein n=1 Tax=Micromonospora sp. RP3T TaxID=2135446 RepID=UPI003D73D958